MDKPSVGMVGLAVMGSNLIKNIESRGYACAVYNRSFDVTERFMREVTGRAFTAGRTIEEFVASLQSPRKIFIMVKAGTATDAVIDALLPALTAEDILIDGGNAYFKDTIRREARCREQGVRFLGVGISGGEEGALRGPSIMPGGAHDAWLQIAPLLDKIAAQAEGSTCTSYIGPDGSGHFVKMVHNGIEYGDMQLIAEAYHLLREIAGTMPAEMAEIFSRWNAGDLSSFLIEITAKIFRKKDGAGPAYLVDMILDKAGQKGTGKWTVQEALELGVPIPTIAAAVDARALSSMKEERVVAARSFTTPQRKAYHNDNHAFILAVHDALYCSKIMAYAQGMAMLSAASRTYNWNLKLDQIAALWRGGCIIRARFLNVIRAAFNECPALSNLVLAPALTKAVTSGISQLRDVVALAAQNGIAVPAFSASLAYFDSYRSASLPQNLTQAQRDFFGAHTYERIDRPGPVHTEWE